MRIAPVAVLLALLSSPAPAQEDVEPAIPKGWARIDGIGKIDVFAPDKKTIGPQAKTELLAAARGAYKAYESVYGLDQIRVRAGHEGGMFRDHRREKVTLLLFPSLKDYEEWAGTSGAGETAFHAGNYVNAVGLPLENGAVPKEQWPLLWHQFSHVFIRHFLYFPAPPWFDEGLAEYLAWDSVKGNPADNPGFSAMLDRLKDAREKGTSTPVAELLSMSAERFAREHQDEAFVLVHLFMREGETAFNEFLATLKNMQDMAHDNPEGVVGDQRKYLRWLVEQSLEGPKSMQAAWEYHRDALLKDSLHVAKMRGKIGLVGSYARFMVLEALARKEVPKEDPRGVVSVKCAVSGTFDVGPRWAGAVSVTVAIGDRDQKEWTGETEIYTGRSKVSGEAMKIEEQRLPLGTSGKFVRFTATWEPDGGGKYRIVKVVKLN